MSLLETFKANREAEEEKEGLEKLDTQYKAPVINKVTADATSYTEHQNELQAIKEQDYSLDRTVKSVLKTGVSFARPLMEENTRGLAFGDKGTEIDYNDSKVQDIYKSVDKSYWDELNAQTNTEDLIATRNQINNARADMQYIDDNHGFAATLAMYGAASVLDPLSYVPIIGQSKKFTGAVTMANKMSKLERVGLSASAGAQIAVGAGISETIIQAQGERAYGDVPVSMVFGFALGSGAVMAASTLKNVNISKKQDAIDKLSDTEMKVGDTAGQINDLTIKEKEELLDVIRSDGAIKPVRSMVSKIFSNIIPHGKNTILTSPTYRAFMKGGKASTFARLVDTPAGLSTKEDGTIVKHVDNTVMDVKYQTYEDFIQLEISRQKTFSKLQEDNPQLKESEFTESVWEETQKLRKQYEKRIKSVERDIKDSQMTEIADEAVTNAGNKLDRKDYPNDEAYDVAMQDRIDVEIDLEVKRRSIAAEKELGVEDHVSPQLKEMIDAQSKYYGDMNQRMIDAGIENADTFLPKYYSPIAYDSGAIKMANDSEVKEAFETAIRNSEDHRAKVEEIDAKIAKAESELATAKEVTTTANRERLLEELSAHRERLKNLRKYQLEDTDFNTFVSQIMSSRPDARTTTGYEDMYLNKELTNKLKTIANGDDFIKELENLSGVRIEDIYASGPTKYSEELQSQRNMAAPFATDRFTRTTKKHFPEMTDEDLKNLGADDVALLNQASRILDNMDIDIRKDSVLTPEEKKAIADSPDRPLEQIMHDIFYDVDEIEGKLGARSDIKTKLRQFEKEVGGGAVGGFLSNENKMNINQGAVGDLRNPTNKANMKGLLRHEYIHAISTRMMDNNPQYTQQVKVLMDEVLGNADEFKRQINNAMANDPKFNSKEWDSDLNHNLKYMFTDEHEFLAVALSNKYFTQALNNMPSNVPSKSMLDKVFDMFKSVLGVDIKKDSMLDKLYGTMEANTIKNKDTKSMELAKEGQVLRNELDKIHAKYPNGDVPDKVRVEKERLYSELARVKSDVDRSATMFGRKLKQDIADVDAKIIAEKQSASNEIELLQNEKMDIEAFPRLQASGMVDGIKKQTQKQAMGFEDVVPSILKKRKLDIDYTDPALRPYMRTNEAQLSQMYQYAMSGRIATEQILGTSNSEKMRAKLIESGMDADDVKMSMETFELALGTKQIPDDPDNNWEKFVRTISHVNYLTMGGQFAKSGLTEIGMGVYRTGFDYIKELVPALGNVIDMYRGKELSKWADDARSMSEANGIYSNNFLSSYSDTDHIESNFARGFEGALKKGSQKFFRYSGLEGVTTLTQMALPRAFLRRIIKESNRGLHSRDLMRWGINPEDMDIISSQPVKYDKNGNIEDFNFDAWDEGVADKFMVSTQRMSRDAIMRPDAVRLPTWVNDGGTNPLFKLTKQFMSFTMLSHERLMLAGMNERSAMAMVGASVSAAILIAMERIGEEVAVASGAMDDSNRYYTDKEEGWNNLFKRAALRNPMMGNASTILETSMDVTSGYGADKAFSRVAGGPTGGRVLTGYKAIEDAIAGKSGTRNQINTLSSLIPAQNLIGVAAFTSNLKSDIIEYQKARDYQ